MENDHVEANGSQNTQAENFNEDKQSFNEKSDVTQKSTALKNGESPSNTDTIAIQEDQIPLPNNNFLSEEQYDEKMRELENSDVIEMKEDIYASYYEIISMNPKAYIGKRIKSSGFVYKEEGFDSNQLVVSRFIITQCIADAIYLSSINQNRRAYW
jgi:putative membrane protein